MTTARDSRTDHAPSRLPRDHDLRGPQERWPGTVLVWISVAALLGMSGMPTRAELSIAATTPIVADLARQVGGDDVQVTCLVPDGNLSHVVTLSAEQRADVSEAGLVLASGKGLEASWLDEIRAHLGPDGHLLEVGKKVPSVKVEAGDGLFVCCPGHAHGTIDPNWWHSVKGMRRATRYVAKAMAKLDPAHADGYRQRGETYDKQLDGLDQWIREQVQKVPTSRRTLATMHNDFAYFCRDYGFAALPLAAAHDSGSQTSEQGHDLPTTLREHDVTVVFPPASPAAVTLPPVVAAKGVKRGPPLLTRHFADDVVTYDEFMRHNVTAIVEALGE